MTSDNKPLLKFELSLTELPRWVKAFQHNRLEAFSNLTNEVKQAVEGTLNAILKSEITLFLGN
jgi:hypothetical protein